MVSAGPWCGWDGGGAVALACTESWHEGLSAARPVLPKRGWTTPTLPVITCDCGAHLTQACPLAA